MGKYLMYCPDSLSQFLFVISYVDNGSGEDNTLARVSVGGRVRAVRIRRSIFNQDTFDEVARLRTVVTAVILLTMVVVGSKQLLNG